MDTDPLHRARQLRYQAYELLATDELEKHAEGLILLDEADALDPEKKAGPTEDELRAEAEQQMAIHLLRH